MNCIRENSNGLLIQILNGLKKSGLYIYVLKFTNSDPSFILIEYRAIKELQLKSNYGNLMLQDEFLVGREYLSQREGLKIT